MLTKGMTHFTGGAVAVIGHGLDQHRHTAWRITFIGQLFNVLVVVSSHAAGNGPVNGVTGHIGTKGLVNDGPQPRVIRRIASTIAGSHRQLPDQLGENLAALSVLRSLAMLDVGPFTMSSHVSPRN